MGSRPAQFLLVMEGFSLHIPMEATRQSSIGSAIGVQHQDDPFRSMQAYRLADLFQHEFTIALALGRSQALGSAGNLDGVGVDHANLLEKLAKAEIKAIVETPENGRIALIFSTGSVEVEDFLHGDLLNSTVPGRAVLWVVRGSRWLPVSRFHAALRAATVIASL